VDLPDTTVKPVVADVLAHDLSEVSSRGLRLLFAGDEFHTWVTSDAVIKFPTSPASASKLDTEFAMHPALRAKLGDLVPEIIASSESSSRFPLRATAYRKARGRAGQSLDGPMIQPKPWARAGLAGDLAAALAALHAIPVRTAKAAGVRPGPVLDDHWLDAGEAAIDRARAVAGDGVDAFLGAPLPPEAREAGKPVVCHTALKGQHLFVSEDGARLTAIVDWADLSVAEPAVDLAGLTIWLGPSFATQVAGDYGAAPGTAERGVYLGRAGLLGYLDAIEAGRERAPERALLDAQLRAAFGPDEQPRRRR
jgi:phosphotransferase family enzyme